jgi:hypothetical protein
MSLSEIHGIYIVSRISIPTTSLKYVYVWKNENGIKSFSSEILKEKDHLQELDID